jgi:hypothetical protein
LRCLPVQILLKHKMNRSLRLLLLALIALCVLAAVVHAQDDEEGEGETEQEALAEAELDNELGGEELEHDCLRGGEMRRSHHCASVRHTDMDHCCWLLRDGSYGKLPNGCCGTGWKTHGCEAIIDDVCTTHADDM